MRAILEIEFGYVRAYINSVGLQAQILQQVQQAQQHPPPPLPTQADNDEFVGAVVTAARSMLRTVVDELEPFGGLQHIPIRTYSRILAGAMFCLKVFSSLLFFLLFSSFILFYFILFSFLLHTK